MAEPPVLAADMRLWRSDGVAATVRAVTALGVFVVVDGERSPSVVDPRRWRLAAACDYCDQAAEVQLIDGQPWDVLCRLHARDHFDRPADWVRPIPQRVVRALWSTCRELW
ncbi:hypothetical protein AB0F93_00380 [Micromonospora tulbaghiae]|uniref:hypothetical protein n=1 Tax=Micromonospora tulbaghiae TaxID=479978 RepID=UPI003323CF19